MAEKLMEVISGATHGSYSFIHDNYIYRINKFTYKRVYLSCRLGHCRGAGKGIKGASREEIYGFKLSKPHNHPPEENKIRQFEVKEYVREEAQRTQDTSKEIHERAVKLFNCYYLSRACVDGLVKRSRERTASEVAEKRVVSRNSRRKRRRADEDYEDDYDDEIIEKRLVIEPDVQRNPAIEDGSGDDLVTFEKAYQEVEGREEVYERTDGEKFIEVVVRGQDEREQHELPVEYVVLDEGIKQDSTLSPDHSELIVDYQEAQSSDPDIHLYESDSPDDPSSDTDSSFDLKTNVAVPRKRSKRNYLKLMNISSQRLPKQPQRAFDEMNTPGRITLKRHQPSDSEEDRPVDEHLSIEESLMKIFSSTYFTSKDNVFSLINSEPITGDGGECNALTSMDSLNVIKSASKLCSFTAVKASQMKNLLIGKTKELHVLQDILLEHLSNLMCFSGTEFFRKCFGKPLREAIEQGKREDLVKKAVWNEDEIYSTVESRNARIQLAVALLCYSGKAYTALGELIDLPGPHIARKWATNSEGNPGFSSQPFAAIRKEAFSSRSKTIFVCLSMEDVELMRQVESSGNELFGYTDLGYGRVESDSIPEATRAVVFYVTAINAHWKLPLGYCLADGLSPQVRTNLLSQYISKLEFSGVKCVGVVLNNSTTSAQIYEEFGVILKGALPLGTFHTNADEKIRVSPFVDVMEVMKSVKLLWKEKQSFFTSAGDEICWSHLESIQKFISSEDAEWDFKPGTYSMDFMNSLKFLKMHIKKDPWPFGRYYTALMNILQKHGANVLENANPTITFIDRMVEITEIFTCCNRFHETKFSFANDKDSFTAINKLIHYLENLKFPCGSFIKDQDRRMPIMNLCMNLASLKVVLRRVQREKGVFHRLTMSSVKEFISGIRNDRELLTPGQFKKRYLKYIQNLDISPSASLIRRHRLPRKISQKYPLDLTFFSSKLYIYVPLRSMCDQVSNFFVEKVINIWIDAVDCPECLSVMLDGMRNENSALHQDLVRLTKLAEIELGAMGEIPVDLVNERFHVFANRILNGISSFGGFKGHEHLFVSGEFGCACHFISFTKDFVEIYLRLRIRYMSREVKIGIGDFRDSSLKYSLGQCWA